MPVFLRWILIDLIVRRVLQHPRVRDQYNNRVAPLMSQYTTRYGRRYQPVMMRGARFVRRRPRLGCCSGCLLIGALAVITMLLLSALTHWLF